MRLRIGFSVNPTQASNQKRSYKTTISNDQAEAKRTMYIRNSACVFFHPHIHSSLKVYKSDLPRFPISEYCSAAACAVTKRQSSRWRWPKYNITWCRSRKAYVFTSIELRGCTETRLPFTKRQHAKQRIRNKSGHGVPFRVVINVININIRFRRMHRSGRTFGCVLHDV